MKQFMGFVVITAFIISSIAIITPTMATSSEPRMYILGKPSGGGSTTQTVPWGITRVNAIAAAAVVDESTVKVAIIDTGMDLDHKDLAARYLWGWNLVRNTNKPEDDNGHGTHCAGTIAGINNALGVVGVAPTVGLYILKALDSRGSGTYSNIVNAIYMAVRGPDAVAGTADDADVISMSLGGPSGTAELQAAVNYALSYNVVIVAATGNDGASRPSYPAAYAGVIKVGATDSSDNVAYFSNGGETILAPGVSVYSTYLRGGYATMSGTSMATPHVAGVVALAWAAHSTYTGAQIRTLVENSHDAAGIVNALAVV
jgi:subtilisin family serine protease